MKRFVVAFAVLFVLGTALSACTVYEAPPRYAYAPGYYGHPHYYDHDHDRDDYHHHW